MSTEHSNVVPASEANANVGDGWFDGPSGPLSRTVSTIRNETEVAPPGPFPEAVRRRVARWAARFAPESLTDVQRRLLESDAARDEERALREESVRRAQNAQAQFETVHAGFYEGLSEADRALVASPGLHPGLDGRGYPLGTPDMAMLTGATERQIRHWDRLELLPSVRVGGRRMFYSAALARALQLQRQPAHVKSVLAVIAKGGADADSVLAMIGSVLVDNVAQRSDDPTIREELTEAGETLVRIGGAHTLAH